MISTIALPAGDAGTNGDFGWALQVGKVVALETEVEGCGLAGGQLPTGDTCIPEVSKNFRHYWSFCLNIFVSKCCCDGFVVTIPM